LGAVSDEDKHGWNTLQTMYREWPFFRGAIDNAELALATVDMEIGAAYADLMVDQQVRRQILGQLEGEYKRACAAVLRLSGNSRLLQDTSWLERSIANRNPCVDPLNLIQIALLRRMRADEGDAGTADQLRDLLRLSIQGISAGMRNTG
jgi:phosphoenolpyruvate carboxylase